MQPAQQTQRKSWQKSKISRVILVIIGAVLIGIPITRVADFFGLFITIAGTSYLLIRIVFSSEKRTFPNFIWEICTASLLCIVIFYKSATLGAASNDLNGLAQFLLGTVPIRLIVTILLGVTLGTAIIVVPMLMRAYSGVIWVLALNQIYGITTLQALWLTICLILKINRQVIRVENGQVKEIKPQGWPLLVGGPALVIIRPYNAVVFEQAGQVTRVEGPGTVLVAFEERIKETIDLRKQSAGFNAVQVLTRDRVSLRVSGGVGFRIQRIEDRVRPTDVARMRSLDKIAFLAAGRNTAQSEGDASHVLRQSVYDAAYGPRAGQKFVEQMQGDVESEMRKAFRAYNFNEIYNLDGPINEQNGIRTTILDEILKTVRDALRLSASTYGVHVFGASIKTIQIEQEENVRSAYFAALASEWRQRLRLSDADAENQMLQDRAKIQIRILNEMENVLQKLRAGLQEVANLIPELPPEVVEDYMQVSERLLENVIIDNALARRYLETMETLARVSPNTIIAAGIDVAQMSDFIAPNLQLKDNAP